MLLTEFFQRSNREGFTQLQTLEYLIQTFSLLDHKFYSGDGHLIPQSSYLPRKDAPSGTLS